MKKRAIALLLVLLFVLSIYGCACVDEIAPPPTVTEIPTEAVEQHRGFTYVDRDVLDFDSKGYSKIELKKGYDSLPTSKMKECYNEIDKSVYYIGDTKNSEASNHKTLKITLSGDKPLTEAELRVVISAYFGDHPQVFWIDNNFEYATGETTTVLQLFSFMSAPELKTACERLTSKVNEIFSAMPRGLDEYDRELFLHDLVVKFCDYAEEVDTIEDNYLAFTSYGALVNGDVVCEGYSRSLQMLLAAAGVESYCTLGRGENELHMWNCVKLYNNWYYTDATWNEDDTVGVGYEYFNLSEGQISEDHSFNPLFTTLSEEEICGSEYESPVSFNVVLPTATEEDMNYYVQSGVPVQSLDSEDENAITQAIKTGATNLSGDESDFAVYIYIDENLDYGYATENLFYSGYYMIFDCIDQANSELDNLTVSRDDVGIRKMYNQRGVTVYLTLE